jgi:4-hydroxy-tetrahydrodipicolinate reductase
MSKSAPIRVVLFGVGVIGSGVLRLARTRPEIEIAGAVVRDPRWEGRPLEEIVPDGPTGVRLSADGARVLSETEPDVVVIATRSTLPEIVPTLALAAKAKAAIACTAEELAYIRPGDGPEADEIFRLADSHHVAIVAVGLNPGFVLDVWPLALASIAHDVTAIDAERAVDLSGFGPNVRASLGVGYSAADFDRDLGRGKIAGHRGFRESLRLIGEALGRPVDETNVETTPIFAKRARTLIGGELTAGQTAGVRQLATGRSAGTEWLRLTMTASVALDEIGVEPVDRVHISGSNDLTAVISPGSRAVPSTVGRILNAIPAVAVAPPGVHTAADLGLTPGRAVR